MKVLYFSLRRSEERPLLANLDGIEFKEVKILPRNSADTGFVRSVSRLQNTFREMEPNIVLLEGAGFFSLLPLIVAKRQGIPTAVRVKGNIWREYKEMHLRIPLKQKLKKIINYISAVYVLKKSDVILPIADYLQEVLHENLKVRKPVFTVHIPFNEKTSDGLRERPIESKFVLTVTNFNFFGKIQPLLEAIKIGADVLAKVGYKWIVLGDGLFHDHFLALTNTEHYRNVVRARGKVDVGPFYKYASAHFYVSGMDGLPNVLLESFYAKLPVFINYDCPAVEFIENGENGIVMDFVCEADIQLAADMIEFRSEQLDSIVNGAYEKVTTQFTTNVVSEQLRRALEFCLEIGKSRSS